MYLIVNKILFFILSELIYLKFFSKSNNKSDVSYYFNLNVLKRSKNNVINLKRFLLIYLLFNVVYKINFGLI